MNEKDKEYEEYFKIFEQKSTRRARQNTVTPRPTDSTEKTVPEKTQAKKETDCDNLLTGCHTAHSLHCPYL